MPLALLTLLAPLACRPAAGDTDAGEARSWSVVAHQVTFARRFDDGTTWGFDLDGVNSGAGDDEGCGHEDLVTPAGDEGVDSALSAIVPALEATEAGAVEGLIEDSINNGELLLLVEVEGVEDITQDDCVDVTIWRGGGTPLVGTDGRLLDGQTFAPLEGVEPTLIQCVPLVDGAVDAGPFDFELALQILDVELTLTLVGGYVHLDLGADGQGVASGDTGAGTVAGWGYLAGGVPTSEILTIVSEDDLGDIRDLVTDLVNYAADLKPDETGVCQELSVVLEFEATEAFIFKGG
jgi:hypothetical protein